MKKKSTKKTFLEEQLEAQTRQEGESGQAEAFQTQERTQEAPRAAESASVEEPAGAEAASVETEALVTLIAERDQLKDQLLRARAEFENFRKRTTREIDRFRRTAEESLVRDLLPVIDHLELALKHADQASQAVVDGVQMVAQQFAEVLSSHGVEPIPALGEVFDPNVHEAIMQRADEAGVPNTVLEEFQRGYRMGDLILRPSKVVVCSAPAEPAAEPLDEVSEEA